MTKEIQVFQNTDFGQLEVVEVDGKPYFPATRCAEIPGYTNPNKAVIDRCRWITKRDLPHPQSHKKTLEINFIPEGGLYRLIVRSKLSTAEKFERWVFDEVLPSIRKHGLYAVDEVLENPDLLINALQQLKAEREKNAEHERTLEKQKPKILFADAVSTSETTILVGELAKILKGNGLDIGQNRLYELLRNKGYLINRKGSDYNAPTQYAMNLGLFKVKETAISHSDGHVGISKTTKVTGKGQQYFINFFMEPKLVPAER